MILSEGRDRNNISPERDDAPFRPRREDQARSLAGKISCVIGILFAVYGIVIVLGGGAPSVTSGVLGAGLGILGYFLGSRRLGTATIILSVAVLFFGLAASQGLVPGIDSSDRGLPAVEPRAGE